ncbi:MAG: hemolysin III family protein [Bacilli bacterium]
MPNITLPIYSKGEKLFNSITHIVGGAFSIAGLILGLIFGYKNGLDAWGMISIVLYGVGVTVMYTMSSIYHFLNRNAAKKVFRVFDHCAIYLAIAGTYSPLCLIALNRPLGFWLLGIVWGLSIIGITANSIDMTKKSVKIGSMISYILIGWFVILAIKPLINAAGIAFFMWILAGGLAYTVGAILYLFGKEHKWFHSIFHLFVLLGSVLQYIGIFFYLIL